MKKCVCVSVVVMLQASGCCSIFTSGPQTVSIRSEPPGAKVEVGPHTGVTPYSVTLPRGKDYVITAKLDGTVQTRTLQKSIEPVYWVNILFWPGLIIDLATGKMFEYQPTLYKFDFTTQ